MQLHVTVNLDNASFEDAEFSAEVPMVLARIMSSVINNGRRSGKGSAFDSNGNRVGTWRIR